MQKEKICGVVIAGNDSKKNFYIYKNLYTECAKKYKKFYIINLNNFKIFNSKKKKLNAEYPKNFIIFTPKTKFELYNFFLEKDLIAFNCLGKSFNYFYILALIKKLNIKLILVQNLGDISNTGDLGGNTFITVFFKINRALNYLIFRFFTFINVFPVIEIYFESKKEIVKNCQNNFFMKKLESIFPFFKFYYFRKVVLINSKIFDELKKNNNKLNEKYIVFLDSNIFHQDRVVREGEVSKYEERKYFKLLENFLMKLSILYKKKVIICLHPSSNEKIYRNNLKKFKITKYSTQECIKKSFIVIFHESSSVVNAIFLKKKIICANSKTLGSYNNSRIDGFLKKLPFLKYNLDDEKPLNKIKLIEELNLRKKKYNNYIKNNIITNRDVPGKITIINELSKKYNL